eukprot:241564-Pleurochrysis_carterae.AAC.2
MCSDTLSRSSHLAWRSIPVPLDDGSVDRVELREERELVAVSRSDRRPCLHLDGGVPPGEVELPAHAVALVGAAAVEHLLVVERHVALSQQAERDALLREELGRDGGRALAARHARSFQVAAVKLEVRLTRVRAR